MRRSGFTMVEYVLVMTVVTILSSLGITRIRDAIQRTNVRSARDAITTLAAKARAAAVQRGCRAVLHVTPGADGQVWVTVCAIRRAGLDTLGGFDPVAARFAVVLEPSRDSIQYDAHGLRIERAAAQIRLSRGEVHDSVLINELGKVVR